MEEYPLSADKLEPGKCYAEKDYSSLPCVCIQGGPKGRGTFQLSMFGGKASSYKFKQTECVYDDRDFNKTTILMEFQYQLLNPEYRNGNDGRITFRQAVDNGWFTKDEIIGHFKEKKYGKTDEEIDEFLAPLVTVGGKRRRRKSHKRNKKQRRSTRK